MSRERINHVRPGAGPGVVLSVTPDSIGWRHVSTSVVILEEGDRHEADTGDEEIAIVPLAGSARLEFAGQAHEVSRTDVFSQRASIAYLPPRTSYAITAQGGFEFATGGALAEGRLPARLIAAEELPGGLRGAANVARGVTGTLDLTLPAERLLAYEIVTPSGNWSSFPPHLHDGTHGSTAHEETYYYRIEPLDGFAVQRIYGTASGLDLTLTARHGDLILVHEGFHTVAAAPGSNVYYLNFLAGDVRPVTQFVDPAYAWVADDWAGRPVAIPIGAASEDCP